MKPKTFYSKEDGGYITVLRGDDFSVSAFGETEKESKVEFEKAWSGYLELREEDPTTHITVF